MGAPVQLVLLCSPSQAFLPDAKSLWGWGQNSGSPKHFGPRDCWWHTAFLREHDVAAEQAINWKHCSKQAGSPGQLQATSRAFRAPSAGNCWDQLQGPGRMESGCRRLPEQLGCLFQEAGCTLPCFFFPYELLEFSLNQIWQTASCCWRASGSRNRLLL